MRIYCFGVNGEILVIVCDLQGVGNFFKFVIVFVCGSNVFYKCFIGSVFFYRVLCGVGQELWRVVIDVDQGYRYSGCGCEDRGRRVGRVCRYYREVYFMVVFIVQLFF